MAGDEQRPKTLVESVEELNAALAELRDTFIEDIRGWDAITVIGFVIAVSISLLAVDRYRAVGLIVLFVTVMSWAALDSYRIHSRG